MKVADVREKLKKYDQKTLIELFVSTYKLVPKASKELNIDPLIEDYAQVMSERKVSGSVSKLTVADFDMLESDIVAFLDNAYAGNYYAANRIVPKAKRSKWRFMVKNYIKQLSTLEVDDMNYERSVELLSKIYKMLSYACGYYLFSTEDPFRSVGIQQEDLYNIVAERTFATGYSNPKIKELILLATTGYLSREALDRYMYFMLLPLLKTADLKYMAIDECKKLIEEKEVEFKEMMGNEKKRGYSSSQSVYEKKHGINKLTELVMYLYVDLWATMDGVPYFYKHHIENDKEVTFYILLRVVEYCDDEKIWCQVYEDGVKKRKIKPRENLREKYAEFMANQNM